MSSPRTRTRTIATLALVGLVALPIAGTGSDTEGIVATYRDGTVTAERRAGFDTEAGGSGRQRLQIEEMLLVVSLAGDAREAGRDTEREPGGPSRRWRDLQAELRRERQAGIEVTEEEIDRALAEHPDALQLPRRVRLRTSPDVSPDADPASKALLRREVEEVKAQVAAGADFAQLAQDGSDSQTRFRGGLIGNVRPGQLPPAIESIALALAYRAR
ncbi:MAG: peptidylprolyl isomerase [Thermoanaerobaculia bacterium]